jgi:hypothetical protein
VLAEAARATPVAEYWINFRQSKIPAFKNTDNLYILNWYNYYLKN